MITIPNNELQQKYYDNLTILWEALFLEINDKRIVSFISPEDFDSRVSSIRESVIIEELYSMLNIFGEVDFYTFVLPAIKELQDDYPLGSLYVDNFEFCFSKLIK